MERKMKTQMDERRPYTGEDEVNAPRNFEGRTPEYGSNKTCPDCGRRIKYLAADRLYYCMACELEIAPS
jgi:hypothetical protein